MKKYIFTALCLLSAGALFAQAATAQQDLEWVSVDRFQHHGFWSGRISSDAGFIQVGLRPSEGPAGREPIEAEEEAGINIPRTNVLGVKVDFLRRGAANFFINARRPIPIEGVTREISVWAVGRNFNHTLFVVIEDFYGRRFELPMGRLNFQGWQQLTVSVPQQPLYGRNGVVQRDYHSNDNIGIRVVGFKVEVDPMQAVGTYYLYLDDLTAHTDLFAERNRDPDDMRDDW